MAHGFHRWLDTLVEASHSLAIRWVANPFLELFRNLLDRFPTLWLLDPGFPDHLRALTTAMREGNEDAAIQITREYNQRIDGELLRVLAALVALRRRAAKRGDLTDDDNPLADPLSVLGAVGATDSA
jgi:DNA-binding GntR family transcriptional regulator